MSTRSEQIDGLKRILESVRRELESMTLTPAASCGWLNLCRKDMRRYKIEASELGVSEEELRHMEALALAKDAIYTLQHYTLTPERLTEKLSEPLRKSLQTSEVVEARRQVAQAIKTAARKSALFARDRIREWQKDRSVNFPPNRDHSIEFVRHANLSEAPPGFYGVSSEEVLEWWKSLPVSPMQKMGIALGYGPFAIIAYPLAMLWEHLCFFRELARYR